MSTVLERLVVGADCSDLNFLNLLVVSTLTVTVLVARMVLATFPTWVLLVMFTSTSFLVFWGPVRAVAPASCCSTSLLDLNFHAVHLCGNLLRLGTDILENVDPRVCSDLDLAFCAVSAFSAIWYFSASTTFCGSCWLVLIPATWFLNLLGFSILRSSVLAAGMILSHVSTWVFLAVFLVNSFLVYTGLVRVVALG